MYMYCFRKIHRLQSSPVSRDLYREDENRELNRKRRNSRPRKSDALLTAKVKSNVEQSLRDDSFVSKRVIISRLRISRRQGEYRNLG